MTRRGDIARLFAEGRRASGGALMLVGLPNGLAYSRLGVAVGSRHGGAVERNRIKRLCREAFRLCRHDLPHGWDYMMVPRPGGRFTLPGLQAALKLLAGRVTGAVVPKDT